MKNFLLVAMVIVCAFAVAAPAGAAWYGITDDFSKSGFNIDYSLSYDETSGAPYTATFKIIDNSNPDEMTHTPWSITGFYFKFFEGSPLVTLSTETGLTAANLMGGFWGYNFNSNFLLGAGNDLNLEFTFQDGANALNSDAINFKVLYLGGEKPNGNGNYTGQLSSYLAVPEPGTVILLGCGLLGLALTGARKKFRK